MILLALEIRVYRSSAEVLSHIHVIINKVTDCNIFLVLGLMRRGPAMYSA
jgi:hypothetical protein